MLGLVHRKSNLMAECYISVTMSLLYCRYLLLTTQPLYPLFVYPYTCIYLLKSL